MVLKAILPALLKSSFILVSLVSVSKAFNAMESQLPAPPRSDIRDRLTGHIASAAAMDTEQHVEQEPSKKARTRSSSFSNFGRSLSRILPGNRKEKGGTLRSYGEVSRPTVGNLPLVSGPAGNPFDNGKAHYAGDLSDDMMRTRSWSPKKNSAIIDEKAISEWGQSKPKRPGPLKRLWDLHKTAQADNGSGHLSQHPDGLMSKNEEQRRADHQVRVDQMAGLEGYMQRSLRRVPEGAESALKRSQKIHEEKKARRVERDSYRNSDDYLGIQGANPLTGYPDPSTATSSTAGDGLSTPTRKRLEDEERRVESASREYKAALERREKQVKKVVTERARKRREKKERFAKRRTEMNSRMKDGKWRLEGNKWSLVTETDLSPILQSASRSLQHGKSLASLELSNLN